jgi:hypothetical protein
VKENSLFLQDEEDSKMCFSVDGAGAEVRKVQGDG